MRLILSTAALLALSTAGVAEAQRVGHGGGMRPGMGHMPGPRPGMGPRPGGWGKPNMPGRPRGWHGPRWGGKMQGRWWGGWRAPGGWGGYHRPFRGYVLPSYWIAPSWGIADWSGYGLTAPYNGYHWSRYYDDAVLIDGSGRVYDTIGGVDWDRYDPQGTDYRWDGRGDYRWDDYYADGGAPGAGYDDRGVPGAPYGYDRRDDGAGGAVAGAVIGGVAGAAIAGRGNRLGGALIGGGVGAVTGYAIDRAEDRGRRGPPPRYGAGYPPPAPGYGGGYAPRPGYGPGLGYGAPIVTQQGNATVVTTNTGGGYYAAGYYFPPSSTTTITVAVQPVTTTTTKEYVTYRKARVWRAKPRWTKSCTCR